MNLRRSLVSAGLIVGLCLLSGCGQSESQQPDTEAASTQSSANAQVEDVYNRVLKETESANAGKSLGEFIDQSQEYKNLFMRVVLLKNNIEQGFEDDYSESEEFLFGFIPESDDQAIKILNDMETYILDTDGDYLSAWLNRVQKSEQAECNFGSQTAEFTVKDTESFLKDLSISPESLGRILAMTDIYASQIDFTDTGFDFKWDGTGGEYQLSLKGTESSLSPEQIPLEMQKNNTFRLPYAIEDGWIYGSMWNPNTGILNLVKRRLEDPEWTYINGNEPCFIRIYKGFLYVGFVENEICPVYKMNLSGDNVKKIISQDVRTLQVYNDTVYASIREADGENYLYSSDLDGNNLTKIFDKPAYYPFTPDGNTIYYQDDPDQETIHRYNAETGENVRISNAYAYAPIFDGYDTLYYIRRTESSRNSTGNGTIVARTISTGVEKDLYTGTDTACLQYAQGKLYFVNETDGYRLYSISTTGDNISLIADDKNICYFNISQDKLFFTSVDDNGSVVGIYCSNLDGSNKTLITI